MSMWSTFYLGDINRLQSLLGQEKWKEIEDDQNIQIVDFSGGALQPFLIGEDFDQIVFYLKDKNTVGISTFADSFTKTIWGDQDTDYQAVILDSEFIRSMSNLSDDSLADINALIINKHTEKDVLLSRKLRKDRVFERIKFEVLFPALPVAVSLGVLSGPYSVLAKVVVPICSFGILYGLRFGFMFWLNSGRKTRQKSICRTCDWYESLIQLRNLAKTAMERNEKVVYLWSL